MKRNEWIVLTMALSSFGFMPTGTLINNKNSGNNTANLLSSLDAVGASSTKAPYATGCAGTTWYDLTANANNATVATCGTGWTGSGTSASPYAFTFNGSTSQLTAGTLLTGQTQAALEAWVKPGTPSAAGTVIAATQGTGGNGIVLRQSVSPTGYYEVVVGNPILADHPVGYWPFNESSGTTAIDYSGNGNNGTYQGGFTLGQTRTTVPGGSDTGVYLNGTVGAGVAIPDSTNYAFTTAMSAELWLTTTSAYRILLNRRSGSDGGFTLQGTDGNLTFFVFTGGAFQGHSTGGWTSGAWFHFVATYDGSNIKTYRNGVLIDTHAQTGVINNPATASITRLGSSDGSASWNGSVNEVAIYNYALTPAQVLSHYNFSPGLGGVCQSTTQSSSSNWNLLDAIYTGTIASLVVNGKTECSTSVTSTLGSTNFYLGSDKNSSSTSYWSGALAMIRSFGAASGTVLTQALAWKGFDYTANRFRTTPITGIEKGNLIFHLDPANAKQGLAPFANGCASTDLSWFNVSSTLTNGALENFSSCSATSGWVGTGTPASPYALVLDGSNDIVNLGNAGGDPGTSDFSIELWFNTTNAADQFIAGKRVTSGFGSMWNLIMGSNGAVVAELCQDSGSTNYLGFGTNTSGYNNGVWHHLVLARSGATGRIYIDGTERGIATGAGTANIVGATTVYLGARAFSLTTLLFKGSLGPFRVYLSALSPQQVKQNCLGQVSRFDGASCAPL